MFFVQIEIMLPHCLSFRWIFVWHKILILICTVVLSTEETESQKNIHITHNITLTGWINWNDMMKRYYRMK